MRMLRFETHRQKWTELILVSAVCRAVSQALGICDEDAKFWQLKPKLTTGTFSFWKIFHWGSIVIHISEEINRYVTHSYEQTGERGKKMKRRWFQSSWEGFCASRERDRKRINRCWPEHIGGSGYGRVESRRNQLREERFIAFPLMGGAWW